MHTASISIIVPCYNEAEVLPAFLARVNAVASQMPFYNFEFLFIDDGSRDASPTFLAEAAARDERVKVIRLSRNHGHQRALTAGIDFCRGDFVILMDADLQDPPELIPRITATLVSGFDVVHLVRADREVDSWSKRTLARLFYRFMRRYVLPDLVEDSGDFKGFNQRALVALRTYRERVRFVRGAFATLGFRQTTLPYVRAPRAGGNSKYPLRSTVRLARDAVFSNSSLPLRWGIYAGGALSVLSALTVFAVGLLALGGRIQQPLIIATLIALLGCAGLLMLMLGFVGEYLKILLLEVKQRPLYTLESTINLEVAVAPEASVRGS